MSGETYKDAYPKAQWTRPQVEAERQTMLEFGNVASCELSEDDENYYLTWVSN